MLHEPCFYCDGTGQLQSKADHRLRDPARRSAASAQLAGLLRRRERPPGGRRPPEERRARRRDGGRAALHAADRARRRARSTTSSSSICRASEAAMRDADERSRAVASGVTSASPSTRSSSRSTRSSSEYVTNISRTGVFVRSQTPLAGRHQGEPQVHRDHGRHRDHRGRSARSCASTKTRRHGRRVPKARAYSQGLIEKLLTQRRGAGRLLSAGSAAPKERLAGRRVCRVRRP